MIQKINDVCGLASFPSKTVRYGLSALFIEEFLKLLLGRAGSWDIFQTLLVNNQPDALFSCICLFISSLYMFRASSAHHQEIELY